MQSRPCAAGQQQQQHTQPAERQLEGPQAFTWSTKPDRQVSMPERICRPNHKK
jgi:hypothetical protein